MEEYRIERLNATNLKDLVYLMKTVHVTSKSIEYYKKKFDTSYTGIINIGYFAYDSLTNEPAAFYGVFPCFLTCNNKLVLGCQSGDTITNPKHQKKGLFIKLAKETYKLAKENGIQLVFGFPNSNSEYGFVNKLDWIKIGNFNIYSFKFKNVNLYNIFHKIKNFQFLYNLYFTLIYKFISGKPFSNTFSDHCFVEKNKDFFQYKKYEKNYFFKISEYNFWGKFEGGLTIGDIKISNLSDYDNLYNSLKKLCNLLGIKNTSIICMPDSVIDKVLSKENIASVGISFGYLLFDSDIEINKLHFSWSDSDTF
jgi:hypothetical protein